MSTLKKDIQHATRGAVIHAAGFGLSSVLGLLMAVLVPKVLGIRDYGNWIIFRSMGNLLVSLTVLGAPQVLSRFYVSDRTEGKDLQAFRLFKTLTVARLLLSLVVGGVGAVLLLSLGNPALDRSAALFLILSVVSQNLLISFMLLLNSERLMVRIAFLLVVRSIFVPGLILFVYPAWGFAGVPIACAIGDSVVGLLYIVSSLNVLEWPTGWLERSQWSTIFRFAGATAISLALLNLYPQLLPFLMGHRQMPVEEIGLIGLSFRCTRLLQGALGSVAAALFPFLVLALQKESDAMAVKWHSLICRLGLIVILAATGTFIVLGQHLVGWVWGEAYEGIAEVLLLCLIALAPSWVGCQYCQLGILFKQTRVYVVAAVVLVVLSLSLFFLLGPGQGARGGAIAWCVGAFGFAVAARAVARRVVGHRLGLGGTVGPVASILVLIIVRNLTSTLLGDLILWGLWAVVFLGLCVLTGSLRWYEVREIAHQLIHRKETPEDGPASGP
jgi:O-antigen/teichoic acid export membrane protein